MSEHTQGKMIVTLIPGSYQRPAILEIDGQIIAELRGDQLDPHGQSIGKAEANARRLAACWNVLCLFSTEQIEKDAVGLEGLLKQRDELLVACKQALTAYDVACDNGVARWTGENVDAMRSVVAKAEAQQ